MHSHHHHHLHAVARSQDEMRHIRSPPINWRRGVSAHTELLTLQVRTNSDGISDEKPVSVNTETIPIVLAVVIPVIVACCVLIYLHRRNLKKLRAEDAKDAEVDLDYGIVGVKKPKLKRKSLFGLETQIHKPGQLSMDMNLSSPYLIDPAYASSKDSLAKTFLSEHDPYRTVSQYANSDSGSIRSFNPMAKEASLRSGMNSNHASMMTGRSMPHLPTQPQSGTPKSLDPMDGKLNPFATPRAPESTLQTPVMGEIRDSALPVKPIMPQIETIPSPSERSELAFDLAELPSPPPRSAARDSPKAEMLDEPQFGVAHGGGHDDHIQELHHQPIEPAGLGLNFELPSIESPTIEVPTNSYETPVQHAQPPMHTFEHDGHMDPYAHALSDDRESVYYDQHGQQGGLNVPQQDSKRVSVGFRPLPPDEVMENEDPEFRANRIRSFYKEYFEDSYKEPAPPLPSQHNAEFYDEYNSNYLADAAYYDVDTNTFVMPYAQPVTRRAMTPPPAGRRGPPGRVPRGPPRSGPRGPGSVGGMSAPGGRGRPRAGSAFTPRPGSSASGRFRGPPKKKLPPPVDLNTLPTPSKLKDDSFAIFNAADFAPPSTFKDVVAGRSQSPLGERRPYSPSIPAASPLVTAFDELADLPTPHMLRKSSTFTGLDFAPPKRIRDPEMSDAGSIRSNRSGISSTQLQAIRSGAGRVSRLPGDTVFESAAQMDQLKPQWGMRP